MRNFPTLFLGVLLFSLNGGAVASEAQENIPLTIKQVHAEKFRASRFVFSEDGTTFIIVNHRSYEFRFYRSNDFSILEQEDEIRPWESDEENKNRNKDWREIRSAGYIDANTWYYIEEIFSSYGDMPAGIEPSCGSKCRAVIVHIKALHPPKEIYTRAFDAKLGFRNDYMDVANSRYVFFGMGDPVLDWRTNEIRHYPIGMGFPYLPPELSLKLTQKGQILISSQEKTLLGEPFKKEEAEILEIGGELTPDERHMVALKDNGECIVWQFEERREIGRCGTGRLFGLGIKEKHLALSRDGKTFATSVNQKIRVYSIEPFRLLMEITAPQNVITLALSGDGRIAGGFEDGRIQVWEVPTGKIIGQGDVGDARNNVRQLTFQPGGNLLAAWSMSGVLFFELPARAEKQIQKEDE
ncbi:MAG: WD40 repeat domain-containing protein [Azoarcus sp.]|jgi:hypothetical protein|nr:WD40 repeat domain-containing protein [Azoarcus sp.]